MREKVWARTDDVARLGFRLLCILMALAPAAGASGQNCDALTPSGGDDAPAIQSCLLNLGRATLQAGTFLIDQPIQAVGLAQGVRLTGAGKNATKIYARFTCGDPRFLNPDGSYRIPLEVRRSPGSTLAGFHLDLDQLRQDCGHGGNYAVVINRSGGSTAENLKITGSQYGTPEYTSGWGHGGGVLVVNSAGSVVRDVAVKDVGFITGGHAGIQLNSSGSSLVQNNNITRVAFGLQVVNGSPSQGFTGDSSHSIVTGNSINGAAGIGCPFCTAGRALKMTACGVGDELPIRYLTVTNNTAGNWGGPNQGAVVPSGLDLHCGVQYSTFTGNNFVGDSRSSYGLQIRSSFMSPQHPTHHNVFRQNTFRASGCSGCFDVFFTGDGPDQGAGAGNGVPSIGRRYANAGGNSFVSMSWNQDRGCQQFAHAWFDYPPGQNFVFRGQRLTVAAAGIRPSAFLPVTYVFRDPNGNPVLTRTFYGANGNCVLNQQTIDIDPAAFAVPGLYRVFATYYDGNSDAFIKDDWIGTRGLQVALDVR